MISIIICSINQNYLNQVRESIGLTIGTEFELLVWDNKEEQLGLCTVYNRMAARASYPYLLFVHEDVTFHTQNWGQLLVHEFEKRPDAIVAGIAGSSFKSAYYSGWLTGIQGSDYFNILHHKNGKAERFYSSGDLAIKWHPCVAIDGVFIFCRKSAWQEIKFNETLLKGFHFYDIDFSIRASLLGKVFAILTIDLVHYTTGGDYGEEWVRNAFVFHKAYQKLLPQKTAEKIKQADKRVVKTWLDRLKNEKINFKTRIQWVVNQKLYQNPVYYYHILKFLLYRPLRLSYIHTLFK